MENYNQQESMGYQAGNQFALMLSEQYKIIKEDAIKSAVESVSKILDEVQTKVSVLANENKNLKSQVEDAKAELDEVKKEQIKIKEATYVLATDDGKMKELTRLVAYLTYSKYTKNSTTLKYKLFHRAIIKDCYKHLYGQYQINTYKRIKIDEFDESIKVITRWFGNEQNVKRTVSKRLKEYISDKNLSKDKQLLVDKFLDEVGGVV